MKSVTEPRASAWLVACTVTGLGLDRHGCCRRDRGAIGQGRHQREADMLVMLGVPGHHVGKLTHAGQLDRSPRARAQRYPRGRDRAALFLRQGPGAPLSVWASTRSVSYRGCATTGVPSANAAPTTVTAGGRPGTEVSPPEDKEDVETQQRRSSVLVPPSWPTLGAFWRVIWPSARSGSHRRLSLVISSYVHSGSLAGRRPVGRTVVAAAAGHRRATPMGI